MTGPNAAINLNEMKELVQARSYLSVVEKAKIRELLDEHRSSEQPVSFP
jgi:hypothetical protein